MSYGFASATPLEVLQIGDPRLRQKSKPLQTERPLLWDQEFIDDLNETQFEFGGSVIAAPQVGDHHRIVIISYKPGEPDARSWSHFLINPTLSSLSDERADVRETCLCVPGRAGVVSRHERVHLEALTRHGEPLSFDLSGRLAALVQQGCDYLDGILFVDHVKDTSASACD